jgi:hypothetical protein
VRVAYADPPYPGQAAKHYRDHPDYAGEVDHSVLIGRLTTEFDAWVLHTASTTLKQVLALCPDDVRIGAWTKPFASFKPGVNPRTRGSPYCSMAVGGARVRTQRCGTTVRFRSRCSAAWQEQSQKQCASGCSTSWGYAPMTS